MIPALMLVVCMQSGDYGRFGQGDCASGQCNRISAPTIVVNQPRVSRRPVTVVPMGELESNSVDRNIVFDSAPRWRPQAFERRRPVARLFGRLFTRFRR